MMRIALLLSLIPLIPLYAFDSLSSDEVRCELKISWGGSKPDIKSVKTGNIKKDSPEHESIPLNDLVKFEGGQRYYSLDVDKNSSLATLRIGKNSLGSSVQTTLNEGQRIGWELGDPYSGPDESVKCVRGGNARGSIPKTLTCSALRLSIPTRIGTRPEIINYKAQTLKVDNRSHDGFHWEDEDWGDLFVNPYYSEKKDRVSLFMDEISAHFVDVFGASLETGKRINVRKTLGDQGYEDYKCQAN